jgi:hypothetical protein
MPTLENRAEHPTRRRPAKEEANNLFQRKGKNTIDEKVRQAYSKSL